MSISRRVAHNPAKHDIELDQLPQTTSMQGNRVRTVAGSCGFCKKRRIKCDLAKPSCQRCEQVGVACDYNQPLIRWSSKPCRTAPAKFQLSAQPDDCPNIHSHEERALGYFKGRLWPLLTTASEPCDPPILLAVDNKVLLLATCLMADTHRVLQDGRNSRLVPQIKRLECLSALRGELRETYENDRPVMMELLLAVLLLYFHAGYLECTEPSITATTASHHSGVNAIMTRLGGVDAILDTGPEALHMLISEFASTDLTSAMLTGGRPSFAPEVWDKIDQGSVWWSRDPLGRVSLASVLCQMSKMAHYRADIQGDIDCVSPDVVRDFQEALMPVFAPLDLAFAGSQDVEAIHTYSLIRSFQHAALIYLYRTFCGLPASHVLVQQHVLPCLDSILSIQKPSKVLNCVIFPLLVAGAHVQSTIHRKGVVSALSSIHDHMKFASVQSVIHMLEEIWRMSSVDVITWDDLFLTLNPNAAIL